MRRKWILAVGLMAAACLAVVAWLAVAPPELLRIGDGYAAKIVCSSVFITGRDPVAVLAQDVQAPGNPLLRFVRISVDDVRKTVTARLFGFVAPAHAIYREGLGCTNVTEGEFATFPGDRSSRRRSAQTDVDKLWPDGEAVAADPKIQSLLSDTALTGPGMRAVLVVKDGHIVAETYGDGFNRASSLLGWSMAKSVTAALIGLRINEGQLALDRTELFAQWRNDPRSRITLADLMGMQSGLQFDEDYGDVTDVTRMLYLEGDMAGFAASKPLVATPGTRFSYSSGTTTILSRIWMDTFPNAWQALSYPRIALFRPLGMTSAVMEPDAHGTFVGSSYLYATARDWGRFALFLLQDGAWNGQQMLPPGFVAFMRKPTAASGGAYGSGQVWTKSADNPLAVPADTFWMLGHDGQSVMLVPSLDLAVVRLGLTPDSSGYDEGTLQAKIVAALD